MIGFVRAVATDGAEKAAEILGRSTPLASVCGRVCPAPCMEGCNRAEFDGSVQIRGLERWVASQVPVATKDKETHPSPKRIAIVGSGPAGIGAAYELAKLGHAVTIFEAEKALGGVLRTGIPTYQARPQGARSGDRQRPGARRRGARRASASTGRACSS